MNKITYFALISLTTSSVTSLVVHAGSANAQVIPDGLLPTIVTLSGNSFTIDGGTRSGNNLFHSFGQFSVPTGGAAIFNNAIDIQNIFSRITGGAVSNIDGLIQANGNANLFLLNPSGILFGPNASLNIGGSFIGTTANGIQFADGVEFSAVNLNGSPLLTMSVPIGLQMGQNPGAIAVQGSSYRVITTSAFAPLILGQIPAPGLSVASGQTLALVGSAIDLNGGVLSAPQGRIELGAVAAGSPPIQIAQTPQGITLSYGEGTNFQDINLRSQSLVDVSGMGAGAIQVQGRQVKVTDGSLIFSQNRGFQPAGSIRVNASEGLELIGTTPDSAIGSSIHSETLGIGKSADIFVSTRRLLVQDGGFVTSKTYAPGASGNININASESLQILGFSAVNRFILSLVGSQTYGPGSAGQVNVYTRQLTLRDGGFLSISNFGSGSVGDLVVNAAESVEIAGVAPSLRPAAISASALRSGNAGSVIVNTRRLTLLDGGTVDTSTFAVGNAGNVTLNVTEAVEVRGIATLGGSASSIGSTASISEPFVQKDLGLPPSPSGSPGNVTINTPRLVIADGAEVTVQNQGTGKGGTQLQINTEDLILNNRGAITAATASGEGGNIFLNVNNLLLMQQGSLVSATAGGTGNGGNITINAPIILGLENSDIIANAIQGRGGNIDITTQGLIGLKFRNTLTPRTDLTNDITASSQFNINGTVQVSNVGVDPNAGLVNLPVELVDPSQQIAQSCATQQGSSFVISGRGGMHENPINQFTPYHPWADLRSLTSDRHPVTAPAAALLPTLPLVEAVGWRRTREGQMELFAAAQPTTELTALPVTCAGGK